MKKVLIIEISVWFLIIGIILGVLMFCQYKFWIKPNTYTLIFKDINGITRGSMVRYMGINIGYVRKLKSKDKNVIVEILVNKKGFKIPEGTVARVEFYGLVGSKSIELMPPENSSDKGIIIQDTIRLSEMASKTKGIVGILEVVEKLVRGLNANSLEMLFYNISVFKGEEIQKADKEISNRINEIKDKRQKVSIMQNDMAQKIDKATNLIEKLNKFIKK